MKITTTCIAAYPKPDYIDIGNFAETEDQDSSATRAFTYTQNSADQVASTFPPMENNAAKTIFTTIAVTSKVSISPT